MGFLDEFGLKKVIQILRTKFSEIDHVHLGSDLRSAVPIERGGTGAEDAFTARLNLGAQAAITGGASSILATNLTASRALISNSSGKVAVSDVTSTELGYLDGVTSNIQTQLNAKIESVPLASTTQSGIVDSSGDAQSFYGIKRIISKPTQPMALSLQCGLTTEEMINVFQGLEFRDALIPSSNGSEYGKRRACVVNRHSSVTDASDNRLEFWEYSPTSDGSGYTGNIDIYKLPVAAAGSTSDNWYDIITTKNLTDIPDADASTRGLVSTGDQTFAGDKTFNGDIVVTDTLSTGQNIYTNGLRITNTTGNGSSLIFRFSDASSANSEYARIYMGFANNGGQLHFRQYSGTSSAKTNYYEQYDLPTPDEGRTSTGTYSILTTKYSWELANGVATSFNIPKNSRHIITVVGSNVSRDGVFLVRATSNGSVGVTDVSIGSAVTHTQATNNFTITVTGGGATMLVTTVYGSPVTKN